MSRSQSQIGQSTWADTPFTLEKNPGVPMATYTPVILDGSLNVIPNSAFAGNALQQYQIRSNVMQIPLDLFGTLPGGTDSSVISIGLPSFVTDVRIDNSSAGMAYVALIHQFGGAGFFIADAEMFDAYLFIDIYPVWSVDAITAALTAAPVNFALDPVFFRASVNVTFQFEG